MIAVQIGEIKDNTVSAEVAVSDGKGMPREYFLFLGSGYLSVVNDPRNARRGRATRLSVGKTFHDADAGFSSVISHYKRDGTTLVEVAREMQEVRAEGAAIDYNSLGQGAKAMTEAEYLDPKRFPLTTQIKPSISFEGQRMIDAMNLDALNEVLESGGTLDENQKGRLTELTVKIPDVKAASSAS